MPQTDDLKLAYTTLANKQALYAKLRDYYDGNQPLRYSAERLRRVFEHMDTQFSQNWCAVVVDAVLDRLNITGWTVQGSQALSDQLNDLWTRTEMTLDDVDAHLAALVIGEAFVIVGRDESTGEVEAYYNDPLLCHLWYETNHPRQKRMAAKWWVDDEGKRRLTLYYANRLEHYVSSGKAENVSNAASFVPAEPPVETNIWDEIPIFHLRRSRRSVESELTNVIPIQDAVNKLMSDMMVAAEFGAFRQRWVISNADLGTLKNSPSEIWDLPAGNGMGQQTSVGEFGQADLNVYLNAMDKLSLSLAAISRTPKHFFFGAGGDPSGEALVAMEAPLNKKCAAYIERFSFVWRDVARFMFKAAGQTVDEMTIEPVFASPETVQPMTRAQVHQTETSAGIPLRTVLRREGWSSDELDAMDKDKATESAAGAASFGAAMAEAARRASAGETEV